MKILLAIDIGNTKTEYLIANENGEVLSSYIGEGANYQQKGWSRTVEILTDGVARILCETKLILNNITYAFVGAAGADTDLDFENLNKLFKIIFNNVPFDFENDGIISLKNGIIDKPGMVITCGTGNVNCAMDKNGNVYRLGGYTLELGDVLGMETIAKRICFKACRSFDQRELPSILPGILVEKLNINNIFELINMNIESDIAPVIVNSMHEACDKGDGLSLSIAWELTSEVINIIDYFYKNIFKNDEDIVIALDGHIFRSKNYIVKMISNSVPVKYKGKIVVPKTPPVFGAYYYCLNYISKDISDVVIENLKQTYLEEVKNEDYSSWRREYLHS